MLLFILWGKLAMGPKASIENRLKDETSPYLRQHSQNPVDWYPWGPEALELSRRLDRPIFLSIGYSACHWCHVMETESFEDPQTARILNENFVSIKVDREERPDLDQIYMTAVQMMTGQGGWPMSVFLTPQLQPFYGGTYFPPDDRYGRPSFQRVLLGVADAWKNKRADISQSAFVLTEQLQQSTEQKGDRVELGAILIQSAVVQLAKAFDRVYGGFGSAPKFPHAMEIRLLLRDWKRRGDEQSLEMAKQTLDRMAMGGMYDHLGGGFHRYSTDSRWLVPHFEKMLYDNALLTMAYVEAFQATGEAFYREVAIETVDYALREMTSALGPFYSTQDADSEGEEGKFFVWSGEEIRAALDAPSAKLVEEVFDIRPEGNWEGKNILFRGKTDSQEARLRGIDEKTFKTAFRAACERLYEQRGKRVRPGRDEKVLTAWNGLMIEALAMAGSSFDNPVYIQAAEKAAEFIIGRMRADNGRLWRTWSAGFGPKLNAYLEDYAFTISALIALYEATFAPRWIKESIRLADIMIDQFWDAVDHGFFFTGKDHEALIARTKEAHDSSIPSGNAVAALALGRLAKLTGRSDFMDKAQETLTRFQGDLRKVPLAMGQMLMALDFFLGPVQQIAVIGDSAQASTVLRSLVERFRPNQVVAFCRASEAAKDDGKTIGLLEGKEALGGVTTYICQDFTCRQPLIGPEASLAALV
jgi:uncharacterized protein YyaL (SSP411 family)